LRIAARSPSSEPACSRSPRLVTCRCFSFPIRAGVQGQKQEQIPPIAHDWVQSTTS
jgi:hypothetical protein